MERDRHLSVSPEAPASSLGPQARATLTNPRLSLPSAAIADIRSGTVSEVALSALNQLAATHALAVSVLESGTSVERLRYRSTE